MNLYFAVALSNCGTRNPRYIQSNIFPGNPVHQNKWNCVFGWSMGRIPDPTSLGKVWDRLGICGLFKHAPIGCMHALFTLPFAINQLNIGRFTIVIIWIPWGSFLDQKNWGANGLRGAMQACTRVWGLSAHSLGWIYDCFGCTADPTGWSLKHLGVLFVCKGIYPPKSPKNSRCWEL